MGVRRVVTGETADGASVFVGDEVIEPLRLMPGSELFELWSPDTIAKLPSDGAPTPPTTYWPPVGGARFSVFTLFPAGAEAPDGGRLDELLSVRPGWADMLEAHEDEHAGVHASDTVDFAVVLSGEVLLELDPGEQRTLRAGDVIIQNGTRHRWENLGQEPATLAVVLIGTERR
jgi:mannose-6-phosphate isomerase-like protein (cupin superfamily)